MNRISRFAAAVLVAGGLGLAGFGVAAGTAQAEPGGWPVPVPNLVVSQRFLNRLERER